MSVSVFEFPQRVIVDEFHATQYSKWNAVHHPIVFKMRRADKNVYITHNGDGKCRVNSSAPASAFSEAVVGETVYINSGPYVGNFTVLSISSSPYYIVIDHPFATSTSTGYLNYIDARENYYVETLVYKVSPANEYVLIGTSINRPDADGIAKVDVATFVRKIVSYTDNFGYDVLNERDETISGRFNIQFREVYNSVAQAWSGISSTYVYYMTNSAKQIQDQYGSNMGAYVPNISDNEQKAKFMSDFEKPTYFPGYPFSLAFIFSDNIFAREINKVEQTKDLNDETIATNTYELDNSQALYANRMMLQQGYSSEVKEVDVWLEENGEACLQYVAEDYVADSYVAEQCELPDIAIPETPDEA